MNAGINSYVSGSSNSTMVITADHKMLTLRIEVNNKVKNYKLSMFLDFEKVLEIIKFMNPEAKFIEYK